MTPKQIWIIVGAVVAALVVGVGVTLAITGDDGTDQISTVGTGPTQASVNTTTPSATIPPTTTPPTTVPATQPSTPAPTVVVLPPTAAPTTPPTSPPTTPPTSPPTTKPTSPPTTKPTSPPTTAPPSDPGITPTEIRLAVIADDQETVKGFQAWATSVNNKKGIGGRKIVVDPFLVGGDPAKFAAAVETACAQDFAIVGSLSAGDTSLGNLTTCGIPDLPSRALSAAHRSAPNTYAVVPTQSTKEQVGGFRWLLDEVAGCCEQYVISSTNPARAAATEASVAAAEAVGFTSAGGTALPDDAPQSAYTAPVTDMKTKGATFGRSDLPYTSTIRVRDEADDQGLTSVKAWFCLAQCYLPSFLADGGDTVDDQYVQISVTPFEDAAAIPAMKRYLANGGPRTQVGAEAAAAGLLFQNAANQVIADAGKNGLTRAAVLATVADIDDFAASGLIGPTNVGGRTPNGCFVLMKVTNGAFVRAEPSGPGQLSCGEQNLLTVGP